MKILKFMIFEALLLSDDRLEALERCASARCSNNLQRTSSPLLVIHLQVGRWPAVGLTNYSFWYNFQLFLKIRSNNRYNSSKSVVQ